MTARDDVWNPDSWYDEVWPEEPVGRPVVTVELPAPVRILVTVSRSWRDWPLMKAELGRVHAAQPDAVLVHGDAPKGDRDAAGIWRGMGGEVEAWPADWKNCDSDCRHRGGKHCPYAGLRRNLAMVESSPALCIAFINRASKGASHGAQAAEDAGIPTVRYSA